MKFISSVLLVFLFPLVSVQGADEIQRENGEQSYDSLSYSQKKELTYSLARKSFEQEDYLKAFSIAQLGHKQGFVECSNLLSILYTDGLGIKRDLGKAAEILSVYADRGDSVIETNLSEIYFSLLDFKKAIEKIKKVVAKAKEEDHLYADEVLINEMVLKKSEIDDLFRLEKDNKIRIKNRKKSERFSFFEIEVLGLDFKQQEIFLKFNERKKLIAAKISVSKTEDWIEKSSFEQILDGMYRLVSKKDNYVLYKNKENYIKLEDILEEEILQITFGEFQSGKSGVLG